MHLTNASGASVSVLIIKLKDGRYVLMDSETGERQKGIYELPRSFVECCVSRNDNIHNDFVTGFLENVQLAVTSGSSGYDEIVIMSTSRADSLYPSSWTSISAINEFIDNKALTISETGDFIMALQVDK